MRYEEIINEAATFKSFFNGLKRDCSEVIEIYKKHQRYLYRGLKTHNTPLLRLEARPDRKPKDSPLAYQEALDRWLERNGFDARRRNSYFATSVPQDAKKYGAIYLVFPVNGFKYTWFEDSFDLWLSRGRFYRALDEVSGKKEELDKFPDNDTALNTGVWSIDEQDNAMNIFMTQTKPSRENLVSAIKSDHEIMLTGQYYAVKLDSKYAGTIISFLQGLNDENV